MNRKSVFGVALTLLLIGTWTLLSSVQVVKSKHTQENLYLSAVDIIHPEPGQFSDYSFRLQEDYVWWNISYKEYVAPHSVNVTHSWQPTSPPVVTYGWWLVNTTNRLIIDTDPDSRSYNQTWYVFLIENNVTVGSVIDWGAGNATIVGSEILFVECGYVDCWVARVDLYVSDYVLAYYDKESGVLMTYEFYSEGEPYPFVELTLVNTNIPIGCEKPSTLVYFNLSPNPIGVGENVILRGILIDEFYRPLSDVIVELYARPLTGSWRNLASLATDEHGTFVWQREIPIEGTFIFAVYYPGSEMYELTYSFAVLVVQ